ncbi:hypothetical protein [Archangium sp. Cb G35]|uniref:hypothetical protein n=1 Tax=Archangium sp. Cb G35 TaxID=1920190 RepID=UPI000A8AAF45|nr:hypothetical protein [Archangium sp. Cb G35]
MEKTISRGLNGVVLGLVGWMMACVPEGGSEGRVQSSAPSQPSQVESRLDSYFLATDSSAYSGGATINVAWAAPAAHSVDDGVGLFKVGDPDTAYLSRNYVPAGSSGLLTFSAPSLGGNYELRYLPSGATTSVSASNPFTVSATAGTIFLFSNYEGGTYTLVVDQYLPNIQIGIATFKASNVTLTGPYARNVSVVRMTGYYSSQSTVLGVPSSKVQIVPPEPAAYKQAYTDNNNLAYSTGGRVFTSWAGGGSSTTQVEEYFMSKFGMVPILYHMSSYKPFSGSIPLSVARQNMVVVRDTPHLDLAVAAGNPTGVANITVDVNATVGATSTLKPALTTGALAVGSTVKINNYSNIVGAGGAGGSGGNGGGGGYSGKHSCSRDGLSGGTAINLTAPTTIYNKGNIWGGGGGGGGGSGCNSNAGGGGGAGYVGGAGGAGASQLSHEEELAFCAQDNQVRTGTPGRAGSSVFGEGGKDADRDGYGSYEVVGGDGGGYGQPGQAPYGCVFASVGGAAGPAIKRNGHTVNVPDGAYDTGGGRIRGPVAP